jgi:hypothetical protein
VSDGAGKIHFFSSHFHPSQAVDGTCDLYHFYYDAADASFHKSDGTVTKTLASVMAGTPLTEADTTTVYDASTSGDGWTWSLELDANGKPVVTFQTNSAGALSYWYGRWTGSAWELHTLVTGQTDIYPASDTAEPDYAGGITVDPSNTDRVYMSIGDGTTWEIVWWQTDDGGTTWGTTGEITTNSPTGWKNVRPLCPRGNDIDGCPRVLWASAQSYRSYIGYDSDIYSSPDVRVATINSPADVADLDLWLRADGLPLADNDPVSAFTDLSGNNRHAVQADPAKQPLWIANAVNGKAAVRFDGTNDFLRVAHALGNTIETGYTVLAVMKINGSVSSDDWLSTRVAGTSGWMMRGTSTTLSQIHHLGGGPNSSRTIGSFADFVLVGFVRDWTGSTYTVQTNARGFLPGTVSGTFVPATRDRTNIGGSVSTDVDAPTAFAGLELAELIAINRKSTPGELNMLERYLGVEYDLTFPATP